MGRDVALKVLTADLEDEPDIRTRFHREARRRPPVTSEYHRSSTSAKTAAFLHGHGVLRGATLKDFLKQSDAAPLARKLDLMIQLCAGLGAAHNASIYHRDIKPGNIFVRADGILRILDFGVARLASSSMTAAGFIVGTPDYMSPEQARGADIDGRSDIFSLGGVCYFMVTGRKRSPPRISRPCSIRSKARMRGLLIDVEAPPALAAVIMKALSKKRRPVPDLSGDDGRPRRPEAAISSRSRTRDARRQAPDRRGRGRRAAGSHVAARGRPRWFRAGVDR
jgi:serine/threonine protein kinase